MEQKKEEDLDRYTVWGIKRRTKDEVGSEIGLTDSEEEEEDIDSIEAMEKEVLSSQQEEEHVVVETP